MEPLEYILSCNGSKMEEIASWTEEEDGGGGSGVFLPVGVWFNVFKSWFNRFVILAAVQVIF